MPLRNLAIDFDSFFASVEQQDRPELRGRPVGVVPVLAETTGLIAVSGEAKKLGIKRNTRVAEAHRTCPGIVIVESRPEVYIDYHRRLKVIIESLVPMEQRTKSPASRAILALMSRASWRARSGA